MTKQTTGKQSPAEISQASAIAESVTIAVLDAIEARDSRKQEASESQFKIFKKLIRAKDIVLTLGFFGALFAGAFVTYQELEAKPTQEAVGKAIDLKLDPALELVDGQSAKLERMEAKVTKMDNTMSVVLKEVQHQGRVLDCMNDKTCRKIPPRPSSIGELP